MPRDEGVSRVVEYSGSLLVVEWMFMIGCGKAWETIPLLWLLILLTAVACAGPGSEEETINPAVAESSSPAATLVPEITPEIIIEATPEPDTPVPPATATVEPTKTIEATATSTLEPTATRPPISINGMPVDQFIIMSDEVRQNVGDIYAKGKSLGRNSQVFSILGDSLIATPQSLAKWDGDDYNLGDFTFLQPTIDQYAGSFERYGVSVRVGLHSWSVFDPLWADKEFCLANEDVLACEIRLNNPSMMIIFLGSNDAGSPGGFDFNYRQIVESLIEQGIVPILATKADRFEGGDNVNNNIIRQIAADYQVPLMEFDILADTLPGRGLSSDNVHLTYLEPLDFSSPESFTFGYPVHNLASLMMLDEVRRQVAGVQDQ